MVLVRETILMGLAVVLDMGEEGVLDFSMECQVEVAKDMVGQIFLVNLEVVLSFQIYLVVESPVVE